MSSFFSFQTKTRLARSILTRSHPVYVQFYVTSRCNLACEQCNIIYANSDLSEVPLHLVEKIADNLARIGVSIVLLTGGEPFVRKDLPDIVHAFFRRGMHVRIQTNGLASEQAVQRSIEAGAHDISISLDTIHESLQDRINGKLQGSWKRAISAFSMVNRLLPPTSFSAIGCVVSPANLAYIPDVIRFATSIGWYVSLVPAHATTSSNPRNFRTYDSRCVFPRKDFGKVRDFVLQVGQMRKDGFLIYDSHQYLEDMYRFICGEPVHWRDRNHGMCDSPDLYFAILPNGAMAVCCDYRLDRPVYTFDPNFHDIFFSAALREQTREITTRCEGCLYGSFPEMTITCRYMKPLITRTILFNREQKSTIKKYSAEEMLAIASDIRSNNPGLYA